MKKPRSPHKTPCAALPGTSHLAALDQRTWPEILSYLSKESLAHLRLVSHYMKQIVDENTEYMDMSYLNGTSSRHMLSAAHRWPCLKVFKVRDSEVPQGAATALSRANWPSLVVLSLVQCELDAKSVASIAKGSKLFQKLSSLDISYNKSIGSKGLMELSAGAWTHLKMVNISYNGLTAASGAALAKLVAQCPVLEQLNISENDLGASGIKELANLKLPQLRNINMSATKLKSSANGTLQAAFIHWPNVRIIDISDNRLVDKGVQGICNVPLNHLEELDMTKNWIGLSGGAAAIGTAAAMWPKLKILKLGMNNWNARCIELLFQSTWSCLHELYFDFSVGIGDDGIEAVAEAYAAGRIPVLKKLSLNGTGMTSNGMMHICKTGWRTLETLSLRFNRLSEGEMLPLISDYSFPSLKCLFLSSVGECTELIDCMCASLWPALEELHISESGIELSDAQIIAEAAANFPKLKVWTMNPYYSNSDDMYVVLNAKWKSLERISIKLDRNHMVTCAETLAEQHGQNWKVEQRGQYVSLVKI